MYVCAMMCVHVCVHTVHACASCFQCSPSSITHHHTFIGTRADSKIYDLYLLHHTRVFMSVGLCVYVCVMMCVHVCVHFARLCLLLSVLSFKYHPSSHVYRHSCRLKNTLPISAAPHPCTRSNTQTHTKWKYNARQSSQGLSAAAPAPRCQGRPCI